MGENIFYLHRKPLIIAVHRIGRNDLSISPRTGCDVERPENGGDLDEQAVIGDMPPNTDSSCFNKKEPAVN